MQVDNQHKKWEELELGWKEWNVRWQEWNQRLKQGKVTLVETMKLQEEVVKLQEMKQVCEEEKRGGMKVGMVQMMLETEKKMDVAKKKLAVLLSQKTAALGKEITKRCPQIETTLK